MGVDFIRMRFHSKTIPPDKDTDKKTRTGKKPDMDNADANIEQAKQFALDYFTQKKKSNYQFN